MTKWLRSSEHQRALNFARKAARRGDVIAAERWLKHADRHLLVTERLNAMLQAYRLRDAELQTAREHESERAMRSKKTADALGDLIAKLESELEASSP